MKLLKFKAWEYWPTYMFYLPNIPYAVYLALRAKNLVFFSATNPCIKHSGNGSESKFATIKLIPTAFKPISIFIKANASIDNTLDKVFKNKIKFPLIIKPDVGFRGLLVNRITTKIELITYLKTHQNFNLIIQEFVDYKNECGIFYHRLPNQQHGKITSITLKKYLTIIGDGNTTLVELINKDKRAILYLQLITELHQQNFHLILKKGEKFILNLIGNHSKGTQFINGAHLINHQLEIAIDSVLQQIPNFYYGRLDIKYNSFEDLEQVKNFKIIELNGIISEPTHIYDSSKTTYIKALKEIRNHWKLIYKISTTNHKINNVKYTRISDFFNSLIQLKKYIKQAKATHLTPNKVLSQNS